MGSLFSQQTTKCNYHCPVCKSSGATPNMAGRFFIINETQCQCNGCNTIFEKHMFYAQPENPRNLDGKWVFPRKDASDMRNESDTQPESVQ
uniref:Uncharacterized protein n=1 Tax=viral metagenome TaxID=1070528 RepID=A0A6C0JWW7_9ZZZZ